MLNILVVDDSLIMRRNITKMIESLGHRVIGEAKDGLESITLYSKLKPDLVTMDITMPEMDGITAVKELKKIDKNAKIIMVTSHG
ncbi:response regulator, partial [Sulfuricurvum sp. RIFOXYD2_FULL_44_160]